MYVDRVGVVVMIHHNVNLQVKDAEILNVCSVHKIPIVVMTFVNLKVNCANKRNVILMVKQSFVPKRSLYAEMMTFVTHANS